MARVHVTRGLLARVEDELASLFELAPGPDGVDGLLVNPGDPVDAALLDRAGPSLRVVANFGVGYDNVDLAAATQRRVVVANTPHVLTEATAELTIALLLALLRRVAEGDRLVRRREPWRLDPTFMLGRGLHGLRLGVVGMGRIGREVARLAEAHGMEVVPVGRGELDRLADVDVVTLHVPLRPETRHLVDAAALARLRPGTVLVNTSRGPVVDEAALVEALEDGPLAGVALDVFEHEPDVHPGLLGREDVVLTPHLGSATEEAREAMGMLCVEALRDVLLEGRLPRHALNPEALA
jgi:lactate dehydrogenase-like 2-hydroxyacid dehydrogenase